MIYSMTGYATEVFQAGTVLIQLELKSVNHRFLDITIKSAEEFRPLENTCRDLITQNISRSKIDLKIFFKENPEAAPLLSLNTQFLKQYLTLIDQLKELIPNTASISIPQLLNTPGILKSQDIQLSTLEKPLITYLTKLIDNFKQTQAIEGDKLQTILEERLNQISKIIDAVKPLLLQVNSEYQEKLYKRLKDILVDTEINDTRFQQEFAFFCQKIDVNEEIDRLNIHVTEFNKLLQNGGGQIGKRLDFLCQEMHREANTFGSKSVSSAITKYAIDLKVLIEQIREQVQNIM